MALTGHTAPKFLLMFAEKSGPNSPERTSERRASVAINQDINKPVTLAESDSVVKSQRFDIQQMHIKFHQERERKHAWHCQTSVEISIEAEQSFRRVFADIFDSEKRLVVSL